MVSILLGGHNVQGPGDKACDGRSVVKDAMEATSPETRDRGREGTEAKWILGLKGYCTNCYEQRAEWTTREDEQTTLSSFFFFGGGEDSLFYLLF